MGAADSRPSGFGVLTKAEAARVERRFDRLSAGTGRLALADLQSLPEVAGVLPWLPRVFALVCDAAGAGELDRDGFVAALNALATREQRHDFIFRVFDADGDGVVSAADLAAALARVLPPGGADPGAVAAAALTAHDADGDGALCREEFDALLAAGREGADGA